MLVFESPTDGMYQGHFTASISGNGDLNGDGFSDIVIPGHPLGEPEDERRLYIYLGSAQPDSVADYIIDVPSVDPGDMDSFGKAIAYDGDLNGDGYNDLVVSAPTYDGHFPDAGMVFIYWGGETLSTTPDVVLDGLDYGDDCWGLKFGSDLDTSGDLNDDGYNDLVIGSPGPSLYWNGQVDIFFGSDAFDTDVDWHRQGELDDNLADHVTTGDINGDGYDDLCFSEQAGAQGHQRFVIYQGGDSIDYIADYTSDDIACSGFSDLLMKGDVDSDGFNDLIVNRNNLYLMKGASNYCNPLEHMVISGGYGGVGRVFLSQEANDIYVGCSCPLDASLLLTQYSDSLLVVYCFTGNYYPQRFGELTYFIGDHNGDGHSDYIISTVETVDSPWILRIFTTEYVDIDNEPIPPASLNLSCFPNPARSGATVRFSLAQAGPVEAAIYNIRGQRVATLAAGHSFTAGEHTLRWDAGDAASGIYLVRLTTPHETTITKLLRLQ